MPPPAAAIPLQPPIQSRYSLAPEGPYAKEAADLKQRLIATATATRAANLLLESAQQESALAEHEAELQEAQNKLAITRTQAELITAAATQRIRQRQLLQDAHDSETAQLRSQIEALHDLRVIGLNSRYGTPTAAVAPAQTPFAAVDYPEAPHPGGTRDSQSGVMMGERSSRYEARIASDPQTTTPVAAQAPIAAQRNLWHTMSTPLAIPVSLWDAPKSQALVTPSAFARLDPLSTNYVAEPSRRRRDRPEPLDGYEDPDDFHGRLEFEDAPPYGQRYRGESYTPRLNRRRDPESCPHVFSGDPTDAKRFTEKILTFMTQTVAFNAEVLQRIDAATVQQCFVAFGLGISKSTSARAKGFVADLERLSPPEWAEGSTGAHYMTVATNFCVYMTPVECIEKAVLKLTALKSVNNEILEYNSAFTTLWQFILDTQKLYPRHATRGDQFFTEAYLKGLSTQLGSLMLTTSGNLNLASLMADTHTASTTLRAIGQLAPPAAIGIHAAQAHQGCAICGGPDKHLQRNCPWVIAHPCPCGKAGHWSELCKYDRVPPVRVNPPRQPAPRDRQPYQRPPQQQQPAPQPRGYQQPHRPGGRGQPRVEERQPQGREMGSVGRGAVNGGRFQRRRE